MRWKAVREALREPRAAGEIAVAEGVPFAGFLEDWLEVRVARSLRIEVLCLRAPLKVVFCAGWLLLVWGFPRECGSHEGGDGLPC